MDEDCLAALNKYIRADYVIKCLVLAGYTTTHVLQCVTDAQLDQIEGFVRHTCGVMREEARSEYVGPVFAKDPDSFRLPSGIRCGLLLAVADLRKASEEKQYSDVFMDEACQTELTMESMNMVLGGLNGLPGPSVMMSRMFPFPSGGSGTLPPRPPAIPHLHNQNHHSQSNLSQISNATNGDIHIPKMPPQSPSNSQSSIASESRGSVQDITEDIDEERLKQHSSASIVRLTGRQFLSAHLVRGRDFDMELEISIAPEGHRRATGIFYCHLCRAKRDRSVAVRFSIARNRYPVVSNVLSHLKTHFTYRSPVGGGNNCVNRGNADIRSVVSGVTTVTPPCSAVATVANMLWSAGNQSSVQHQSMGQSVKQETVFPGLLSPIAFSPLDSSIPLNYSVATPLSGEENMDQFDREDTNSSSRVDQ